MPDFLLELRSEEIPARMQAGAREALGKLFAERMRAAGIAPGAITVWSTPRRLALIARDLPDATAPARAETKGPRIGAPAPALDGFLRKTGVAREQLVERDGAWFAIAEQPGRATREVLAEAIPAIVRDFPWPKSMRWGAASLSSASPRWVRPLSGIVAILGEALVACEAGGVASGVVTLGHRFHHPGAITIGGAHDYADKLAACHVIVDHAAREALIRDGARAAAVAAGLALVEDEGLVAENAGLTEWPAPLLGRFDPAFLEVPPEVIRLTARANQKYFVCVSSPSLLGEGGRHGAAVGVEGSLSPRASAGPDTRQDLPLHHAAHGPAPRHAGEDMAIADAFVCTANIDAADGGAGIVAGNRKVLAARLADARFFWEQDRRKTLAEHAEGLKRITFHEKLGTVWDKAERVAKLARWLVEEGVVSSPARRGGGPPQVVEGSASPPAPNAPATPQGVPLHRPADGPPPRQAGEDNDRARLADLAEQAGRLCKADLVTAMVGEFPELQGVMGGHYARAEGLPDEVADAIRDHYKPVGQGDEVPTATVTVAVSLADKFDTLATFFFEREYPTSSRDPYALRRAALAVCNVARHRSLRFSLINAFIEALHNFAHQTDRMSDELADWRAESVWSSMDREADDLSLAGAFEGWNNTVFHLLDFIVDRLKIQQRDAGVRHDLIDAVFALGGEDDIVRLLARVRALQGFVGTEDGANLLAAYKRAANILKKEGYVSEAAPLVAPAQAGVHLPGERADAALEMDAGVRGHDEGVSEEPPHDGEEDPYALVDDPDLAPIVAAAARERHAAPLAYVPEPAESALIEAVDAAAPRAAEAVAREDFVGAMAALASLRAPIDAFFDQVTVNDADAAKRDARLALLDRFRVAVHNVADFSKIEG